MLQTHRDALAQLARDGYSVLEAENGEIYTLPVLASAWTDEDFERSGLSNPEVRIQPVADGVVAIVGVTAPCDERAYRDHATYDARRRGTA
jgi:hypothetical protein